jgi:beta-lactamase class A
MLSAVLDDRLAGVPGTIGVWVGPVGGPPAYTREPDATHYAASMMKVAVLAALHHGDRDLDETLNVHNDFASAAGGRFGLVRRHDPDDEVWRQLGRRVSLGWLAERMITRSSNLATNLVLERIGLDPVAGAWRRAGARHSIVTRGIGDTVAAEAGRTNLVTAGDLARLLTGIAIDSGPPLATLLAQRRTEDLAAGLPPGTRVAHKNGWVMGVRHAAGVVFPDDSPAFVVSVCTTTPLAVNRPDDEACRIVSDITREAWTNRR